MGREISVAGVVYYKDRFLLLKYELGHWDFVKGHIEDAETQEQTIKRELEEETGIIKAKIIDGFKETYDYFFKKNGETIYKKVYCYLIESQTKKVELSFEHVDYTWLESEKAIEKATYDNTKEILRKATKYLMNY
ncbi:MAG: NUDIX domain-containing protein [Promethearchaeota archaeon]